MPAAGRCVALGQGAHKKPEFLAKNAFGQVPVLEDGETVVFSWIEWPSREARVAAWDRIMADDRMKHDPNDQTFDGKRMIYGGFEMVVTL